MSMNLKRGIVQALILVGVTFFATDVLSQVVTEPRTELLWEEGAPGALSTDEDDQPSITIYIPGRDVFSGGAVVVCPGGGYGHLAFDHEGHQVARWLNSIGIAAFILKYRHAPDYKHPIPLNDAKYAIRTIRSRAEEWGIDPNRIGILGFSAGGHLASTAGTHFDRGNPEAPDPIERASSRPDFMVLVYPVITMEEGITHQGSRRNLLGEEVPQELLWVMSNEKQVTPDTPPTFLVHTTNDEAVPVENSIRFYRALLSAGVPAEMHLFERGRHGFGLAPEDTVLSKWPDLAAAWFRVRKIIPR